MDIKAFLKQNALECENEKYVASDRFIDDNKKPIEWEIKPISTDEDAQLRDCLLYTSIRTIYRSYSRM